jgi:Bacterial archaeo-eukaryotic release factor family 12
MSNTTTWAVLSDGRYIKILINKGAVEQLVVLDADDLPAYAELCYLMVNGKPLNGTGDAAISKKINNLQHQADFLAEHHKLGMFDLLVIAAPEDVLTGIKNALPEQLAKLIVGEIAEDLTTISNDEIQMRFADMIVAGIEKAS